MEAYFTFKFIGAMVVFGILLFFLVAVLLITAAEAIEVRFRRWKARRKKE